MIRGSGGPVRNGLLSSPLGQAGSALIGNASIGVKVVCLVVVISYGLSYSESAIKALSMTPGYFWPPHFYLWTAFTHCFLEIHWWEVVVDIVTIVLVGKLLEPLWGALEMVTFFAVINVGTAVVCAVFYYFLYMVSYNTELLFEVHIHGLAGYLAGVSVAVKQAMPDHILYRTSVGKFTNRNIPLTVFGLSFILWAIGLVEGSYCTMFGSGLVISWVYLRFYQMHANGSRGDTADGFAFASFFPNVIQPPVAVFGNTLFSLLVRLKVCKRQIRRYDVSSGGLSGGSVHGGAGAGSISISLPGVENHDTERRRQIALKALSDRLSKAEAQSATANQQSWPSLDGGSSTTEMTTPLLSSSTEIDRTNEPTTSSNQKNVQQPGTSISNEAKLNDEDMNVATDAVLIDINDAVNEAQSSGPK